MDVTILEYHIKPSSSVKQSKKIFSLSLVLSLIQYNSPQPSDASHFTPLSLTLLRNSPLHVINLLHIRTLYEET